MVIEAMATQAAATAMPIFIGLILISSPWNRRCPGVQHAFEKGTFSLGICRYAEITRPTGIDTGMRAAGVNSLPILWQRR
jgi:hypothetical protein